MKVSTQIINTLLLAIILLLSVVTKSNAATFMSYGSGDWNVGATWVGGVSPSATDDVLIQAGHIVTVTSNETILNIEVDTNGELIIASTFLLDCTGDILQNGTITVNGTMTNTGNIDQNGTITVETGGVFNHANNTTNTITQNGIFTVNGTLNLNGGTYLLNVQSSFSGTGVINLENYNTIGPNVYWNPIIPTINFAANSDANLYGEIKFTISAGTVFNFYDGVGQIALSSDITNYGTINIEGSTDVHHLNSNFINFGTTNWNNGDVDGNNIFTNVGNFNTLDVPNYFDMEIVNTASGIITGGGSFDSPITNDVGGVITVPASKTFTKPNNGMTQNGSFNVNGTLNMEGGMYSITPVNSFSGTGTLNMSGNLDFQAATSWEPAINIINFNDGNTTGKGDIVILSGTTCNWAGSSMNYTPTNMLTNYGVINVEGIAGTNSNINNENIINLNSGGIEANSITLSENSIFNLNANNSYVGISIDNYGIINVNQNTTFYGGLTCFSSSKLSLYNNKVLTVPTGNINNSNGNIVGNGSIVGDLFSNTGTISPGFSPGTISITGTGDLGNLNIEIIESLGVVKQDSIYISGNVSLCCNLTITMSGTIPEGSYTILKTGGTITGTFGVVSLPPCFSIDYGPNSIKLIKGQTKIWSGGASNWNIDNNWDPYGVPCPLNPVIINDGEVSLDINPQMKNLTINGGILKKINAATYSINAKITVAAAGTINIFDGILDINDTLDNNGTIQGYTTIDLVGATVIGGYGNWAPGNSSGTLSNTGTYNNEMIEMEIGGNANGIPMVEHDKLNVTQSMVTDGDINIKWLGGTVPIGSRVIMECAGANCRTGTFKTITFPPECDGNCNIIYNSQQVILENTEPIEFKGTCIWLGGNGDWDNASNWSCNDVPNSNDSVVINDGNLTIDGSTTVKSLSFSGGTLTGSGSISVLQNTTWSGGSINLSGQTNFGIATISGDLSLGSILNINENSVLIDAILNLSPTSAINIAQNKSLTIQNSGEIFSTNGGILTNSGTILKSGLGNFIFQNPFLNNPSGILQIDEGGTLSFENDFINNGVIKGTGTLDLSLANQIDMGFVSPGNSPGTLNIIGNYTNKNLIMEILESGGAVTHDLLVVSNNVNLGNDVLTINYLGGVIPEGDYQLIMCSGGITGSFTTINYPAFCNSGCQILYEADGIKLHVEAGLPIELNKFTAKKQGESASLDWTTVSELNVKNYAIFRSNDGLTWEILAEIPAVGNTNSAQQYTYIDNKTKTGDNLYKLKINDLDGSFTYSPIVSLNFNNKSDWKIYPNPVNEVISFDPGKQQDGLFQIIDFQGNVVIQQQFHAKEKSQINISQLPNGIYCFCLPGISCKNFVKQ